MKKVRITLIDSLRGITICSMVMYHGIWDLVYIYRVNLPFMHSKWAFLWQQSICWSFILISGFCWSLGQHPVRQGMKVFSLGLVITLVTICLMPEQRIVFGILTFLGSAMLMINPVDHLLKKIPAVTGVVLSFLLFLVFYSVNQHMIGFPFFRVTLPDMIYRNYLTAYFGFPFMEFFSTDYFSVLPWFFLYLTGYFLQKLYDRYLRDSKRPALKESFFSCIGKYSLWIYMIHQPLLSLVLYIIFHVIR